MNPIATFNDSRFSAAATRDQAEIHVRLEGDADSNVKGQLERFLDAVHRAAVSNPGTSVVVDFQLLKFMTSSCFQDFVMWLGRVREGIAREQYQIAFVANTEQHWQRRSLRALSNFAPEQVVIK
jgi:hypothetical protein